MYMSWAQSLAPHTTYTIVLWSYVTVKRQRWSPGVTLIPVYPEWSLITAFFYLNHPSESKKCVCWEKGSGPTLQPCYTWRCCIARSFETVLHSRGEILCNSHWWLWEPIQQLPGERFRCKRYRVDLLRPSKEHPQERSKTSVLSTMYYIDLTLEWLGPKILQDTPYSDDAGRLGRVPLKQGQGSP